jgi:hypothetical protein
MNTSIKSKSLCIVGNGPSLLRSGLGEKIDAHDHVWRINNYVTAGFEKDCGTKTTGWVTTFYKNIVQGDRFGEDVEKLILPLNTWPKGGWAGSEALMVKMAKKRGAEFICPNEIFVRKLRREISNQAASSGITAIQIALNMGARVSVCGFDFFANPQGHHYFGLQESRPDGCPHKTGVERDWLQWKVAQGEVSNLNEESDKVLIKEYRKLHEKNRGYGAGASFRREIREWAGGRKLKTVLDFGCGKNGISEMFKSAGVKAVGYDPAIPEFSRLPNRRFDGVCCLDVMEHIPASKIRSVLQVIGDRAEKTLFLNISTRTAVQTLPSGRNCHETVCSAGWWRRALREFLPDFEIAHDHEKSDHYYLVMTRARGGRI